MTARRPGRSRGLRRQLSIRLTTRAVVTLALVGAATAAGYATGRAEFLTIAAAGSALLLGALAYLRVRRPRLRIERETDPAIAVAGDTVQVTVLLYNTAAAPAPTLDCEDAVPWDDDLVAVLVPSIPTGSPERRVRRIRYRARPPRRGHFELGPLIVEYGDPFGMVRAVVATTGTHPLVVVPDVAELPAGGPAFAEGEGTAQLAQHRAHGSHDDLTTREYRSGDAMRRVHWRASARHGELMVRHEEQRSHPDVRLVLDTQRDGYPDALPDGDPAHDEASSESFEWAVRMLASVAIHLDEEGFTVAIEETTAAQLAPIGARWEGRGRVDDFLVSLAGVETRSGQGHRPSADTKARGPVIAVLGNPHLQTVDWLVRRRSPRDVGVAVLLEPAKTVLLRLREAGWVTVVARIADDPAEVWARVSGTVEFADVDD